MPFLIGVAFATALALVLHAALQYQEPAAANVMDYGAIGDGVADDTHAFVDAFAAAAEIGQTLRIPRGTYIVNQELAIKSGMVISSDGAILLRSRDGPPLLSAMDAHDWTLSGPLTLVGTRTAAKQRGEEIGLKISGCNGYVVDKLTVKWFKGTGVDIEGGSPLDGTRGDEGRFAFLSLIGNRLGLRIHGGAAAEYTLFTLASFTRNETAAEIAAANTVVSTSNVVDNSNGLLLSAGTNNGHGIVSASNISHNHGFNVQARDIDNGYTFNASHLYGDSPTTGTIRLRNSQGVTFNDGVLDSAIIADGRGTNTANSNFIPGNLFKVTGSNPLSFKHVLNFDSRGLTRESSDYLLPLQSDLGRD